MADIVLEGQERLSQKCNSINEKTKYMNLVVELLNYILFQRELKNQHPRLILVILHYIRNIQIYQVL